MGIFDWFFGKKKTISKSTFEEKKEDLKPEPTMEEKTKILKISILNSRNEKMNYLEREEINPKTDMGFDHLYLYQGKLFNGVLEIDLIGRRENGDIHHRVYKDGYYIRNERYLKDKLVYEHDLIISEEDSNKKNVIKYKNCLEREWYDNGQLKYEKTYLNGLINGQCKEWYNNGQLKFQGIQKLPEIESYGRLDNRGECKWWFENGSIKREETWEDEIQISNTTYFDNEKIESKNDGNIKQTFFKSGNLKSETKSILEGYTTFTNENTRLFDSKIEQKIWNEDGNLTLFGRKYGLNGEYILTEEWYDSLKIKSVSLLKISESYLSSVMKWDKDGVEIIKRTRLIIIRIENTLEDRESQYVKEVSFFIELQGTEDNFEDFEDCDWEQIDRDDLCDLRTSYDGVPLKDEEDLEFIDVESQDFYELGEFKSVLLDDIKGYGEELQEIISKRVINDLENHKKRMTPEENPLKQELLEYLRTQM